MKVSSQTLATLTSLSHIIKEHNFMLLSQDAVTAAVKTPEGIFEIDRHGGITHKEETE
jgi:sulfur transfer complex TusBCD TusB component (DsrH family)